MKKILSILAVSAIALSAFSCAKPDADYVHDDVTISAIKMGTTQKDATGKEKTLTIDGVINQDAGTVMFTVPKDKRRDIDLTAVKFRANVGFDAYVTVTKELGKEVDRTLYGIHDISDGIEVTVTAKMTGRSKNYTLSAKIEK